MNLADVKMGNAYKIRAWADMAREYRITDGRIEHEDTMGYFDTRMTHLCGTVYTPESNCGRDSFQPNGEGGFLICAWMLEPITTHVTDLTDKIIGQVYKAFENLGAGMELLSVVGSWRDTLDDGEVLELLTAYNETGTCVSEILCSVYDTPQDRRDRFKLVKGETP